MFSPITPDKYDIHYYLALTFPALYSKLLAAMYYSTNEVGEMNHVLFIDLWSVFFFHYYFF